MLKFLAAKHLPVEEYYDIVVFGYLRAVARYLSEEALQQYAFSTIAWRCMNADLRSHYRKLARKKRQAEVLSLQTDDLSSTPVTSYGSPQEMEARLLLEDLLRLLSPEQRQVLRMRLRGDSLRQIAKTQKVKVSQVKQLLDGSRTVLKDLLQN